MADPGQGLMEGCCRDVLWVGRVLLYLSLVIATKCCFHVLVPWVCPLSGPTESLKKSGTNRETLKNSHALSCSCRRPWLLISHSRKRAICAGCFFFRRTAIKKGN